MRILAFDTTAERLSVALLDGERLRLRAAKPASDQDEQLPKEAGKLLKSAALALKDVDAFAAATGPGRFTGIRVGLTFAGMLGPSLGKPAIGVSWLEAAAWRASPEPGLVVAVVRGWKDEWFFQLFERGETPRPAGEPSWAGVPELGEAVRKALAGRAARLVGPGARAALEQLPGFLAEAESRGLDASDLLAPAKHRLETHGDPSLAPLYIKPPHYERK
ncbi:MAG: tRNA (adenosine(37)-N6)-threonylcarbamoyltransferase complex dimerization subunit type 1 TsaB [Elusimicrobia bacterium]|nr:tRNA (adenosine(37)-N6)-threonylcarbamoyltransferase complex dimerization subunit type 1 TsaB [Elusimicrobiota bacterium]